MRNRLASLALLLIASGAWAEEEYSAKALFFGEDDSVVAVSTAQKTTTSTVAYKKPATPQHLGASYFIRMKMNDGSTRDMLANRKFRTGERFQLGIKVNRPSYIYIVNQGGDGKVAQIYPQPGQDNFVNAMGMVLLPARGSFEFDQTPGTEQLFVYMSPTPINGKATETLKSRPLDMVAAPIDPVAGNTMPACSSPPVAATNTLITMERVEYASKGINFAGNDTPGCNAPAYASKGIAFSEDPEPSAGAQPAMYVVNKSTKPDASLFLQIRLTHQ